MFKGSSPGIIRITTIIFSRIARMKNVYVVHKPNMPLFLHAEMGKVSEYSETFRSCCWIPKFRDDLLINPAHAH